MDLALKFLGLTFTVVIVALFLKDASDVNTLGSTYDNAVKTLGGLG